MRQAGRHKLTATGAGAHSSSTWIQPAWWRCDEHQHVSLSTIWRGNGDGTSTPAINERPEECSWWSGYGEVIKECGCGTHHTTSAWENR